jgi:hypothetical protein
MLVEIFCQVKKQGGKPSPCRAHGCAAPPSPGSPPDPLSGFCNPVLGSDLPGWGQTSPAGVSPPGWGQTSLPGSVLPAGVSPPRSGSVFPGWGQTSLPGSDLSDRGQSSRPGADPRSGADTQGGASMAQKYTAYIFGLGVLLRKTPLRGEGMEMRPPPAFHRAGEYIYAKNRIKIRKNRAFIDKKADVQVYSCKHGALSPACC